MQWPTWYATSCSTQVGELFELASAKKRVLHTAFNRRHDPEIQAARKQERRGERADAAIRST